jgi:hypothetical protein
VIVRNKNSGHTSTSIPLSSAPPLWTLPAAVRSRPRLMTQASASDMICSMLSTSFQPSDLEITRRIPAFRAALSSPQGSNSVNNISGTEGLNGVHLSTRLDAVNVGHS